MLRGEPTLIILGVFRVMDMEFDAGVTASAKVTVHPTSQVCSEISISFPVITISAGGDDDAGTMIGAMGLSAEWEVISSDKAPFQIGLHYEVLPDKRTQFVEECTYEDMEEEKENTSSRTVGSNTSKHVYYTRYGEVTQTDSLVFCFEYPDNWRITKEEILGDTTNFGSYAEEFVELSNERDIKIAKPEHALSNSNNSDFVVAKLTDAGSMITDVDPDFVPADNDYASYALLSESYIDKYGGNLTANGASIGYYEMVSFDYPTPYIFCAESPDGHFTAEEEQEVIDILCSFRESIVNDGEKITEATIDKRQTPKDAKTDTVWCTVQTEDERCTYKKAFVLTYSLYDGGGWILDEVSVSDRSSWVIIPLTGVNDDEISASLTGIDVTADNETWHVIQGNIKSITIDSQETDLEMQKDIVIATMVIDDLVEEASGQLIINYKFNQGRWEMESLLGTENFSVTQKPDRELLGMLCALEKYGINC